MEEIEALLAGRRQTCVVFFLDETFEELEHDATTTVAEAVAFLAGVIKLQAYQTFTLYECRKARALPCCTAPVLSGLVLSGFTLFKCRKAHAPARPLHRPCPVLTRAAQWLHLNAPTTECSWQTHLRGAPPTGIAVSSCAPYHSHTGNIWRCTNNHLFALTCWPWVGCTGR